jgi:hypothetical protein
MRVADVEEAATARAAASIRTLRDTANPIDQSPDMSRPDQKLPLACRHLFLGLASNFLVCQAFRSTFLSTSCPYGW